MTSTYLKKNKALLGMSASHCSLFKPSLARQVGSNFGDVDSDYQQASIMIETSSNRATNNYFSLEQAQRCGVELEVA